MHPTRPAGASLHNGYPGKLTAEAMFAGFYDPDGRRYGMPTYPYRCAPDRLSAGEYNDCAARWGR